MRSAVIATAICLSIVSIAAADDAKAAMRTPMDIPAQSLSEALKTLAKIRDLQVLYFSQTVRGLRTQGAFGALTANEAFEQLLSGTGLTYRYLDEKTVSIVPMTTSGPSAREGSARGEVEDLSSSPVGAASSSIRAAPPSAAATGNGPKGFWQRLRLSQAEKSADQAVPDDQGEPEEEKLEEITVTAQKRGAQRLLEVPISIDVLEGEALDRGNFEGVSEALNQVAGVNLFTDNQGGGAKISVRGVSSGGPLFFGSSTVGYYLDEMPFSFVKTAIVPDANAYDLERVEILRGPQGTLYGASALNGVVRVLTQDANLDEFEFKARASLSNTDEGAENYRGDFAVNAPLMPGKLAARAVVGYNDLSGWIDKAGEEDTNDADVATFRLKLNARPTEALGIELSSWSSRADYDAPAAATQDGLSTTIFDEPLSADYDLFGLTVNYDFPTFALTSATSYVDYSSESELDFLNIEPLFTGLSARTFAQEVRLHSTGNGPWQWSFGGIYRDSEDHLVQRLPAFLPAPIDFTDISESFAAFGEVSRRFMDEQFEVTLGLRYFKDKVTNRENIRHNDDGGALHSDTDEFNATTPRLVLTWLPSTDLTLYSSYSEGFRSGFPQNANVIEELPNFPSVKEDSLKTYEIGAKASLLDRRVTFDGAIYYIDWQDVQQTIGVATPGGAPVTAVVNGESASGMGVDLGITLRPLDSLRFGLTYGWNDLVLDNAVISDDLAPDEALFGRSERLNESPETTVGLSGDYFFPLGGYEAQLSGSANYHTELVSRSTAGGAVVFGSGDDILDTRLSFSVSSPQHWTVTLFADNLANEDGVTRAGPFGFLLFGLSTERPRPRTVGVQFEYRFR